MAFRIAISMVVSLVVGVCVVAPLQSHALTLPGRPAEVPGLQIKLSPQYPRPGESVQAELTQYVVDARFALITWTVNGQVVRQGYGETAYSFTADQVGSLIDVQVSVKDAQGRNLVARKTTRVSDMAILWEARTHTPHFFLGRPLMSPGADVAIVVLPQVFDASGKQYSLDDLTFEWTQSYQTASVGRGKNSLITRSATPYDGLNVTLRIFDPAGEELLSQYISLPVAVPKIIFYEDDPLQGILYRKALGSPYTMTRDELSLVAEPVYAASGSRLDPKLVYTWNVGGTAYSYPGAIILRPEGNKSGSTDISVYAIHDNNLNQRMQGRMSVLYDDSARAPTTPTRNESTNPL